MGEEEVYDLSRKGMLWCEAVVDGEDTAACQSREFGHQAA